MTAARYTDAEKAAAKRIGYSPVLRGEAPSAGWLADFKRVIVGAFNDNARYYRTRAARIRRQAEKAAQKAEHLEALSIGYADDARLVARAIGREQRKAACDA